jgi:hypothetical protein
MTNYPHEWKLPNSRQPFAISEKTEYLNIVWLYDQYKTTSEILKAHDMFLIDLTEKEEFILKTFKTAGIENGV